MCKIQANWLDNVAYSIRGSNIQKKVNGVEKPLLFFN